MMTHEEAKKEAERLIELFIPHGYPFSSGSGYSTGDLDKDGQKRHAIEITLLCCDEIIKSQIGSIHHNAINYNPKIEDYKQVKQILEEML